MAPRDIVYVMREMGDTSQELGQPRFIGLGQIGSIPSQVLFDSGATRTLICQKIVSAAGLTVTQGTPVYLGVADNRVIKITEFVRAELFFGNEGPWSLDAAVAPTLVYDVVVGTPFLHRYDVRLHFFPTLKAHMLTPDLKRRIIVSAPEEWTRDAQSAVTIASNDAYFACETPDELTRRLEAESSVSYRDIDEGLKSIKDNRLREELVRYRVLFPDTLPLCLPPDRGVRNHVIDLIEGAKLPELPGFACAPHKLIILKGKIDALVAGHLLVPNYSHRPCCSPAFLVSAEKKPRLVGDFRQLNMATRERAQEVPSAQDVLDLLGEARVFTTSDMMSGYHQLRIDPASQKYTTISTAYGRYMYTVTAMGLKNAGTDFQRAVSACLRTSGLFLQAVLNYIDDLIVFSKNMESHLEHLKAVFKALRGDVWYLSYRKSQIAKTRVRVLGHWVENGRVFPDGTYVSNLRDLINPNDSKDKVTDLRRFLGTVGYYRRFIPQFGTIAHPLTRLLRSSAEWEWGPEEESARRVLCDTLQTVATAGLLIFSRDRPTRIATDASSKGLGASLEQLHDDMWTPVSFYSKGLTAAEAVLVNYERELLAIFAACKRWLGYLQGIKFEILCDCSALQNIAGMPLAGKKKRVVNMLIFLSTLSFTWVHIPGARNVVPDSLSRLVAEPSEEFVDYLMSILPKGCCPAGSHPSEANRDFDVMAAIVEAAGMMETKGMKDGWSWEDDVCAMREELCVGRELLSGT